MTTTVSEMTDELSHRGPDDHGVWVDGAEQVALGHRRLSIIDLSEMGHQPMLSKSGRWVIAYNGEVYNYREIRDQLSKLGTTFSGSSDTEVVLAAFEQWGIDEAIGRFVGMFAFALWDRKKRVLHIVRDRLGIKPLYYGWCNGSFIFGSELKALTRFRKFSAEVDRDSLAVFMRRGFIPSPHSIYRNIFKLLPGHILSLTSPDQESVSLRPYWSLRETAENGLKTPFKGTHQDAKKILEEKLVDAIRMRMVADVPVGAFLSGGYDSSLVVALMQSISHQRVQTFSIGFSDMKYDESAQARSVAEHIGTEHSELILSDNDVLSAIPELPRLYDEPFADASQIPTFLVSRMAREKVKVSLSGDGGDELFSGYNRHRYGERLWRTVRPIPSQFRPAVSALLSYVPARYWDVLFGDNASWLPRNRRTRLASDKIDKISQVLQCGGIDDIYSALVSKWHDPGSVVIRGNERTDSLRTAIAPKNNMKFGLTDQLVFRDQCEYLPDDILTKVDRASMGVGLEARVPLLDHRLVEFAWRIPQTMKLVNGQGKWILRQVLYDYVPSELVDRPKAGFAVPIETWLRGPLKEWAENLLDERRLTSEGFFKPAPIRQRWSEHLSGRRDWHHSLWCVLMFQEWLARNSSVVANSS